MRDAVSPAAKIVINAFKPKIAKAIINQVGLFFLIIRETYDEPLMKTYINAMTKNETIKTSV